MIDNLEALGALPVLLLGVSPMGHLLILEVDGYSIPSGLRRGNGLTDQIVCLVLSELVITTIILQLNKLDLHVSLVDSHIGFLSGVNQSSDLGQLFLLVPRLVASLMPMFSRVDPTGVGLVGQIHSGFIVIN